MREFSVVEHLYSSTMNNHPPKWLPWLKPKTSGRGSASMAGSASFDPLWNVIRFPTLVRTSYSRTFQCLSKSCSITCGKLQFCATQSSELQSYGFECKHCLTLTSGKLHFKCCILAIISKNILKKSAADFVTKRSLSMLEDWSSLMDIFTIN